MNKYDVAVLGSGPAGLTAAIYLSRGGFKALVLAGDQPGGQLTLATDVENYPGFESISGEELVGRIQHQAEKFGAKIIIDSAISIKQATRKFLVKTRNKKEYSAKALVVATGASARWLDAPGAGKFKGKGISACAVCDGPFFRNKIVAVIGGGNAALIEAEFLARLAQKVYLIHRRESYRAEKILQDRILKNKKITLLFNSQVKEFLGEEKLAALLLETSFRMEGDRRAQEVAMYPQKYGKIDSQNNEKMIWRLALDGVFIAIGHKPNTDFLKGFIELDEKGYVKTQSEVFASVKGVFSAGDCVDWQYRQAITAAGMGCKAAIETVEYLKSKN